MESPAQLFVLLLLVGIFLIGAEIFLPGGVVGFLGGLALLGAMIVAFFAFGPQGGFFSAIVILVASAIGLFLWVRYFPRTRMGRGLSLEATGSAFKSADPGLKALEGQEGEALSILRPAGLALIRGHRLDVVADGMWVEQGRRVRVTRVEGTRILVRALEAPAPRPEGASP